LPDAVVDDLHRLGDGVQPGIGIAKDGKLGHEKNDERRGKRDGRLP
jgi:hypothetical protein